MEKLSKPKLSVLIPLVGLVVAWVLFALALYTGLWLRITDPNNNYRIADYSPNSGGGYFVNWNIYLFFGSIAAISLGALWGQRLALQSRIELGQDHALSRASHRLNNLLLWIGVALGVFFVFANFLSGFAGFFTVQAWFPRVFGTYLPIVLGAGLVLFVILRAFVFRADALAVNAEDEVAKAAARARRRNLGLGYAVPILTTLFAIIVGLFIYQSTQKLQTWVWVFILALVAFGIISGTRFANRAKAGEQAVVKTKETFASLAAGASNLNFVLSILFAAIVSGISLGSTSAAIDLLWSDGTYDMNGNPDIQPSVDAASAQWWIEEFAPAGLLMLLVVVGTYLTVTIRNREQVAAAPAPGVAAAAPAQTAPEITISE